jgi:hypothetical protein
VARLDPIGVLHRPCAVGCVALALSLTGCQGRGHDATREQLHESSVALKSDSAATRAFFETVLGDSVQRERLARVILENEGMRQTLTRVLIEDSLARLPGGGLPAVAGGLGSAGRAPAPLDTSGEGSISRDTAQAKPSR